jgi:hypothetical protein
VIWWVVVVLLALVATGVIEDDGGVLDSIGDAIVNLTTSDEARLAKLEPTTQAQVRALLAQLAADGIGVHVGQTLRTPAEEKQAIDSGHSGVKTHSWHELGRAVDLYPLDDSGSAILNPTETELDLFRRMHARAVEMGFRSLAFDSDGSKHLIHNNAGKAIWDGGHIEWRAPFGSIAEAVEAEGAGYGIA